MSHWQLPWDIVKNRASLNYIPHHNARVGRADVLLRADQHPSCLPVSPEAVCESRHKDTTHRLAEVSDFFPKTSSSDLRSLSISRWSTAYFRCLSLNIPPPVKPRLEYPIPRDYCGVTPGWLKALMYQLQNNLTVSFQILWDRWTGACLEHNTLIRILCLGGFTDAEAIPWLRFISLCAVHLTDVSKNISFTLKESNITTHSFFYSSPRLLNSG